jgi:hypothetical protein
MASIIPISCQFDQQTIGKIIAADAIVQRYRTLFALLDWKPVDCPHPPPAPGRPAHPKSAFAKAFLVRVCEKKASMPALRAFLLEHPLLVLELGFRPTLAVQQPYGFDVQRTLPTVRWLNSQLRTFDPRLLADLFAQTVQALLQEIPGLGEVVSFDVTHIYANVRENNLRQYVTERYNPDLQPTGDPDCRLGVKRSTNQEQADGSTTEKKEYLWGYGLGLASAYIPDYGDVVLAQYTQPFNENDITYFVPLYIQTIAHLGFFPTHITADAAFDAWYVYETCIRRGGIAAIALNSHGHPESRRAADGVPLCEKGLRMYPTYHFSHTYGYRAQRFRCPLLFPQATAQTCEHEQFKKGKGCVKDLNWEAGAQMRVTLDRQGPLYQAIYRQRTSTERANSHAKKQFLLDHPLVRNFSSVRHLNTLTCILINLKALQRARSINASLLPTIPLRN